jgi:hypothetical protein
MRKAVFVLREIDCASIKNQARLKENPDYFTAVQAAISGG